jgi:hypothetical protein
VVTFTNLLRISACKSWSNTEIYPLLSHKSEENHFFHRPGLALPIGLSCPLSTVFYSPAVRSPLRQKRCEQNLCPGCRLAGRREGEGMFCAVFVLDGQDNGAAAVGSVNPKQAGERGRGAQRAAPARNPASPGPRRSVAPRPHTPRHCRAGGARRQLRRIPAPGRHREG